MAGQQPGHDAGGDRSLLRRINSMAALRHLWRGPASVADVADAIGVSRTAAQQIVDDLVAIRWVVRQPTTAEQHRRVGPTPRYYRLRAEAGYLAGVDVAIQKVSAVITDLTGDVVAETQIDVDAEIGPEGRLHAIAQVVELCRDRAGVPMKDLWMIAVGTHGVVEDGRVRFVVHMRGWSDLDLTKALHGMFDRAVVVENDCNLAAMGEHWVGAAQDIDDFVCIQVGRAVGAGIFIGNQLRRGFAGYAGEINPLANAGWKHPRLHMEAVAEHGLQTGHAAVFGAARDGNRIAQDAVENFCRDVAAGIATISAVVDPELVVIGGGVSAAGNGLLEPVRRHLKAQPVRMPRLELSTLGDRAVVLGAVRAALNKLDARIAELTEDDGALPRPQRRALQKRGWH